MCMMMCMRTNIELNDELVAEARKYSRAKTKRALIEEALTEFVRQKAKEKRIATYADRLSAVREKTATYQLREDPADLLKQDRSR